MTVTQVDSKPALTGEAGVQSTDFSRAVPCSNESIEITKHCPTEVGTLNARCRSRLTW